MPASRLPKRKPERPASLRRFWPIALVGLVVMAAIALIVLPASLITRILPPPIHAEDFSGSIWHGSAGKISVESRPAGALEWRLQPLALLSASAAADLHWVKGATVIDAEIALDSHGFAAHNVHGAGTLDDLRELGVAPEWHGNTRFDLQEVKGSFDAIASARGSVDVSALTCAGIAAGANLGSYRATLLPDAASNGISATIKDAGGPLEADAEFHYVAAAHTGTVSGTLKERPEASQALRAELAQLTQLKARDRAGRIPIDLEFTL